MSKTRIQTLSQTQMAGFTTRGYGRFAPDTPLSHLAAAARRCAADSAVVVLTDRADAWLSLDDRPLIMEFDADLAEEARVTVESLYRAGRPLFVIADIDYRDDVRGANNALELIRYANIPDTWLVRDHTRVWPDDWRHGASAADVSARWLDDRLNDSPKVIVTPGGEIECDLAQFAGVA